ncbi:TetR/AcrR family transcriptional regulator [Aeromicrobium sp. A1-2]|uniref:TetR/AcrR family transcriptional regulator n=1 Tax=Aeromicrobium sp. A1-2 TaxID=2107713 RepID=UPI0013C338A3|nr:TetR/AcrR family transcriptional regulator [Aeromicrobium sp. A1-2]
MTDGRKHNTDGRIARGERTRESIVAAHTALLREGVLKPTGKVIADRAGISLRTLWLNFKDLEALLVETTGYWLALDEELRTKIDSGQSQARRIKAYCRMRASRLENIAPAARSARLGEPFSEALRASRRQHVDRVVADVEAVFATELSAAGDRRDFLRAALVVTSSWPTWAMVRDDLGLSAVDAEDFMRKSIGVLLQA